MHKQLLIIFFILVNCTVNSAFAQDTTKNKLRQWGIGAQINTVEKLPALNFFNNNVLFNAGDFKDKSYSISFFGYFFLKNSAQLRITGGATKRNVSNYYVNQYSNNQEYNTNDVKLNENTFHIAATIQWNIISKNKMNFFTGFEVPLNIYKDYNFEWTFNDYKNDTLDNKGLNTSAIPGGFSSGLNTSLLLTYNIARNFVIGSELLAGFFYYKVGGQIKNDNIAIYPNGSIYNHDVFIQQDSFQGTVLNLKLSINSTIFF